MMSRMIAARGVALAVLIGVCMSFGQAKAAADPFKTAEELLTTKDLRASAAMYIATGEDEVKKAAETAETRLKEYRHAAARERAALQEAIDKRALAGELTKQRDELKKQMAQMLPNINAQIQALNQQKNALNMQANSMSGGRSRAGRSGASVIHNEVNQLSMQVGMLQAQSSQLTMTYNQLNAQINELNAQPDAKKETKPETKSDTKSDDPSKSASFKTASTSDDQKEAYVKSVGELRSQVDLTKQKYTTLVDDAEIKSALTTLSQRSAKIKYVLGPSKKFLDTVKSLEQAEAKIASDTIIEWPKASDSAKKKSKTAKKK